MTDFIALHRLSAPGSYAIGYGPGDPVTAQVVEDWNLVIGTDVEPADGYQAPRPAEDSTDRAAWESYVVGSGTSLEDARAASLDDLKAMYDAPPPPEPPAHDLPANAAAEGMAGTGWQNSTQATADNTPHPAPDPADAPEPLERPVDSALKADWVDYTVSAGADQEWAHANSTTKDDLIAWKPKS